MNLDKVIMIVKEHIEEKLGGNVAVTKNQDVGMAKFTWTKNDKTIHAEHLQLAFSYEELEKAINPVSLGEKFVNIYKNILEPVEEPKKKPSRKKKVEESTDESVELGVEEGVKPVVEEYIEPTKLEEEPKPEEKPEENN